ncbi:MAG: hypothetical protein ACYC0Z_13005 [Acidobacteriaceae bacterium]
MMMISEELLMKDFKKDFKAIMPNIDIPNSIAVKLMEGICKLYFVAMKKGIELVDDRISSLEAENAKLRAFKDACEKQEPVAWMHPFCEDKMPLYAHPSLATIEQAKKEERERILSIFAAQDIDPAFKNRILTQFGYEEVI